MKSSCHVEISFVYFRIQASGDEGVARRKLSAMVSLQKGQWMGD